MESIFKKHSDFMSDPAILLMVYILFLREYMYQVSMVVMFAISMILSYVGQFVAWKKGITNKNVSIVGFVLSLVLFIMYICASFIPTFNHEIWKWPAYITMALFYCLEVIHGNILNQTSTRYVFLYVLTFFTAYEISL